MIWLNPVTTPQKAYFPILGEVVSSPFSLEIVNTITRKEYSYTLPCDTPAPVINEDTVVDEEEVITESASPAPQSRAYYILDILLDGSEERGEYEYRLFKSGEVISCGLLCIGEPNNRMIENKQSVEYEQYRG